MNRRLLPSLRCVLASLIWLAINPANATTANWTGCNGSYTDPANWDAPFLICGVTWDVIVPAGSCTISMDVSLCDVNSLAQGSNSVFRVLTGNHYSTLDTYVLENNASLELQAASIFESLGTAEFFGIVNAMGGNLAALSATFPGDRFRVFASLGATVVIGAPQYSSKGLTSDCGTPGSSCGTTTELMRAENPGTLLDLSSVQSIDAGFPRNSNDQNYHEISATDSAQIDLSGVQSITAPQYVGDWIRFNIDGLSTSVNLDSLDTLVASSAGRTRFNLTGDATLDLPALSTLNRGRFDLVADSEVNAGPTTEITDSQFFLAGSSGFLESGTSATYSSKGLTSDCGTPGSSCGTTTELMRAENPGTLLDLSSVQSIDAGFPRNSNDQNYHEISATDSAQIDLSGVQSITAPQYVGDWIRFNIDGLSTSVNLDSLDTLVASSAGRTRFNLTGDATLDLPALSTLNRGRFDLVADSEVNAGPTTEITDSQFFLAGSSGFLESGTSATYSSKGLTSDCGTPGSSCGTTTELMRAENPGTLLDLSSVQSIDAGFPRNSNDQNYHEISATDSAQIDLSGVQSITAPQYVGDWIRFNIDGLSTSVNLDSLDTLVASSAGRTRFNLTGDATLDLPALSTLNRGRFDLVADSEVNAGPTTEITDSQFFLAGSSGFLESGTSATYSSKGLTSDCGTPGSSCGTTTELMRAENPGTLLDLSSVQSIDAGFPRNSNDQNYHEISATDSAQIDLSGVQSITAPQYVGDWIRFTADTSGRIDMTSLGSVSSANDGDTLFAISNQGVLDMGDTALLDNASISLATAGSLTTGDLEVWSNSSISIIDPDVEFGVAGSLILGPDATLTAADDSTLEIGGDFSYQQLDNAAVELCEVVLHLTGDGANQFVEIGGFDAGAQVPLSCNFGFGKFIIGTDATPASVRLRDAFDNGNPHDICGATREALYLTGLASAPLGEDALEIRGGSTLYLDSLQLYASIGGTMTDINSWVTPGVPLAFGSGFIEIGTGVDADFDGVLDVNDNCALAQNPDQRDTDADGFGNICDADLDNDGFVNFADLDLFESAFFTNDPDADLNGDGFVNFPDLGIVAQLFFKPPGPGCTQP